MGQNRKKCVYCHTETSANADKCPSCGASKFESVKTPQSFENIPPPAPSTPAQSMEKKRTVITTRSSTRNNAFIAFALIAVFVFVFLVVIIYNALGNLGVSTYSVGSTINTDWFEMTVYEGKIVRTNRAYCGLEPPSSGYERILVDVELYNHLSGENLDINIAEDFYLEAGSTKYRSLNTGGSYSIFDKLSTDGMFFGQFMVSPHKRLHGYIAFDVPLPVNNLKFVYEEYNYEGDTRTDIKKRYKVDLEYETPLIPSSIAKHFYDNALEAGYILEIINDYDGFGTFWIGAHKYVDESATKGLLVKPEPIYWIDCTQDRTENNAKVEYNNYVDKVKANGGTEQSDSGTSNGVSYQYQYNVNLSTGKFGLAYQIGAFNYLVESAPVSEMQEILAFIESALNLNLKS